MGYSMYIMDLRWAFVSCIVLVCVFVSNFSTLRIVGLAWLSVDSTSISISHRPPSKTLGK